MRKSNHIELLLFGTFLMWGGLSEAATWMADWVDDNVEMGMVYFYRQDLYN